MKKAVYASVKNPKSLPCFLLVFSLFMAGCSDRAQDDPSGLSEDERKEIESDVINRFNAMIMYAEAGELENVLSHYDSSGPGTYIDGPVRYTSFQEMLETYRATWKITKQNYGIPATKLFVLSPNYVWISSASTITTITREGVTYQPRPWNISTLWVLKDGQWLIHSFHQFSGELKPVGEEEKKP